MLNSLLKKGTYQTDKQNRKKASSPITQIKSKLKTVSLGKLMLLDGQILPKPLGEKLH